MKLQLQGIDTPSLLIDSKKLNRNLESVQKLVAAKNLNLRPHFKTHKSVELAKLQIAKGAIGISCSKTEEALCLAKAGIKDIQIANVISGQPKYERIAEAAKHADKITFGVDCLEHINEAEAFATSNGLHLPAQIEINTGLDRNGISSEEPLLSLVNRILKSGCLSFEGIYTHAGNVYGSKSDNQTMKISDDSIRLMQHLAKALGKEGIKCPVVSIGSTPELRYLRNMDSITEFRPGNYIFNDHMQIALNSCSEAEVALYVVASITGVHKDRVILDSGSKALGLDRGAHGNTAIQGYGKIIGKNSVISRLSEEHGIIDNVQDNFQMGEKICIIPNHACAVANLFDNYFIQENNQLRTIKIDARGMSR